MIDEPITMLFDTETLLPGCVILQAIAGTYDDARVRNLVHKFVTWELAPKTTLKLMTASPEQWDRLITLSNSVPT